MANYYWFDPDAGHGIETLACWWYDEAHQNQAQELPGAADSLYFVSGTYMPNMPFMMARSIRQVHVAAGVQPSTDSWSGNLNIVSGEEAPGVLDVAGAVSWNGTADAETVSDFYGSAVNCGTLAGDAEFHGTAYAGGPQQGTVLGTVTFSGNPVFTLEVPWIYDASGWLFPSGGSFTFQNTGYVSGGNPVGKLPSGVTVTFKDSTYNAGECQGDVTFEGTSENRGTVGGDAVFKGGARNNGGTVSGDADFQGATYTGNPQEGTVTGTTIFSATPAFTIGFQWSPWSTDASGWSFPSGGSFTFEGYGRLASGGKLPSSVTVTFKNATFNEGECQGDVAFENDSWNQGTVGGDATFRDFAQNYYGTVYGDADFQGTAYSNNPQFGTVAGSVIFSGNPTFTIVSGDAWWWDASGWTFSNGGHFRFEGTGYLNAAGKLPAGVTATFAGNSYCAGEVQGAARFEGQGNLTGGTVLGTVTWASTATGSHGVWPQTVLAEKTLNFGSSSSTFQTPTRVYPLARDAQVILETAQSQGYLAVDLSRLPVGGGGLPWPTR